MKTILIFQDGFLHLGKFPRMKNIAILFAFTTIVTFQSYSQETLWKPQDETETIQKQQNHPIERMRYKLIASKYLDKNQVFQPLYSEVQVFSEKRYNALLPLILDKDIPTLQSEISKGKFSYEELTLFFLKRIYKYELDPEKTLNTIIALNPNVLKEARECDKNKSSKNNPIFGMPILLKDNIDTKEIKTTAGAAALIDNTPSEDAFIVQRLKENGALIIGKANLSEWAYFFCDGCPVGYSAVGGQTLNPYGRMIFETGGSSAGSGTGVAANYAVAAVGTETAGSIISPSSQNSLVGLKPTVGVLSRSGIVPISHTLDTPGPMTKNVIDNAILLNAMKGKDNGDAASIAVSTNYVEEIKNATLKGKRLGVMKSLLSDSIYAATVKKLQKEGAIIIEYTPEEIDLPSFLTLLNLDMKEDLPVYLKMNASENIKFKNLEEIMTFNAKDSLNRMPYNQELFDGIIADETSEEDFQKIKETLKINGTEFFQKPMKEHKLDAVLSINNYHSAYAAVALYPCLTIPMGYNSSGEPFGLTFIGAPFQEAKLLQLARAFEIKNPVRKSPSEYKE
ncbi:Glutamyl-tRNA(Gln) amidotransferase subunit A [Aequorivita antarctica]|nr:Glutamyl-tRNA(Gln) amidotransferase subunit A [Aequorivita antarctica]